MVPARERMPSGIAKHAVVREGERGGIDLRTFPTGDIVGGSAGRRFSGPEGQPGRADLRLRMRHGAQRPGLIERHHESTDPQDARTVKDLVGVGRIW